MAAVLGRGLKNGINKLGGNDDQLGEVYTKKKGCLQSKFAPYYIVTISLNSVAILAGIFSQVDFHHNQRNTHFDRMDTWYFTNGVFGVLHILACIYIVRAIEKPNKGYVNNRGLPDAETPASAFNYNQLQGATPPPPQNPNYIQAHEVVVMPMDRSKRAPTSPRAPPPRGVRYPVKEVTEPLTWHRIKYVLSEDKFVALYILVFVLYLAWHYFMDFSHINYQYYAGMQFVMRCADIFIMAGPASLLFCIGYTMATRDGN